MAQKQFSDSEVISWETPKSVPDTKLHLHIQPTIDTSDH